VTGNINLDDPLELFDKILQGLIENECTNCPYWQELCNGPIIRRIDKETKEVIIEPNVE